MAVPPHDLPSPPPSPSHDYLDDVFAAQPADAIKSSSAHPSSTTKLERVHYDNGYRDGISTSKNAHVQDGFDEGYTLGAELAMMSGVLLGALEQLCQDLESCLKFTRDQSARKSGKGEVGIEYGEHDSHGVATEIPPRDSPATGQNEAATALEQELCRLKSLQKEAETELSLQSIFGPNFFDEDGIWKWDAQELGANAERSQGLDNGQLSREVVGDGDMDQADVTFRKVAEFHPLVARWRKSLEEAFQKHGLDSAGMSW